MNTLEHEQIRITSDRRKYRDWIRRRHGSIHRHDNRDKFYNREWKRNINHIREELIDQY